MIVYEFWLKEQFKAQAFETLCDTFYKMGNVMGRWDDPRDENGDPKEATCVYSVTRNPGTHWVQLLVDDGTSQSIITAIEARINGLKDSETFRKYDDGTDNDAPIETPRYFNLAQVLEIRRKQKNKTLRRVE